MNTTNTLMQKLKFVIPLITVLLGQVTFAAVNAPELRCVSVNAGGTVTLTWVPPADPNNEFLSYTVYSSTAKTGPYVATSVAGIGTFLFTDVLNATANSLYYFVQTEYDDGSGPTLSTSSDTGQSMLPIFSAVTDSTATITWDPVFDPNIPSNVGIYTVYRKIGPSGMFTVVGTTNYGMETFSDVFKVCSDSIYYKIDIADQSGCVSTSAILEDLFEDNTAPAPPIFDSVSVDPVTGNVTMEWKPSSSPDTYGYMLYWYEKTIPQYIYMDTLFGRFTTTYMETSGLIDPELEYQQFTVVAFDSCFDPTANTSAGVSEHRSIHLKITPNNCENTVSLSWTNYVNWDSLGGYEILYSINNGPYQIAITLTDTDSVYTHTKTNSLDLFCYKIRAFNEPRTSSSTSNEACALSNALVIPKKQYFKQITVEDNKSIHIISLTDTTLPVQEYALLRSLEPRVNFYEVSRIPFNNTEIIELDDFEANVTETPYFYRIGIIDTCGLVTHLSRPSNSMFLAGDIDEDSLNINLRWNPYTSWDSVNSGTANYDIYQIIDSKRELLTTVSKFTNEYKFTIIDNIEAGANFCYEIEAREDSGNVFNQADSALSNRVCFSHNVNVFVPNAFRPGGVNPEFTPVISYGELASYQMIIYDRWGQIVYETKDIDAGWDGVSNGKNAPFGSYVYYIKIANFAGSTFQKKGSFILLR